MRHLACALAIVFAVPAALLAQQGEDAVASRLLDILQKKGVISETERSELSALSTELRREADLESSLSDEMDALVNRLSTVDAGTSYAEGKGFKFVSDDGRFSTILGGRLQVRFTYSWFEDTDNQNEPDFSVPRARIWLQGHAFDKNLTYKFQFDIAGDDANTAGGSSSNRLTEAKDAYFDYKFSDAFRVQAGQFKAPYSRHQLTSSGNLEFVDRAITDREFARGRDVGIMIHGKALGEKGDLLAYMAGAFNGEGENRENGNNDEGLYFAGRVALNLWGAVPYTEADLRSEEGREKFLMAIAVNAFLHMDDNHTGFDNEDWGVGGDVVIMYYGLHFLGEVHYRSTDPGIMGVPDRDRWGLLGQISYAIIAEKLNVGVRVAYLDYDRDGGGAVEDVNEILIVVGYFWHGHNMKLQGDFGRIEENLAAGGDNTEWRLRIQFQIIF